MVMDRQAFDFEVKFAADGSEAGALSGYGSVFGLMDRGGDIVLPGAFKASLADWKKRKALPPMLWQHDPRSPIGVWDEVIEDEKGLRLKGRLLLEIPLAQVARALLVANGIKGLSIGYQTRDYTIVRETGARELKRVDLWEISLVTFPMLPEATIDGVKSFDPRALEAALRRECNMSSAAAVKTVAIVKQHLRDGGVSPEQDPRDGVKDLLMSLRRTQAALAD